MERPLESFFGYGGTAVAAYRERLMGRLGLTRPRAGSRALDLGCGEGQEALYLSRLGYRVDAVDQEPHRRWKEVERQAGGRIRFSTGNAQALRQKTGSYDLVFEKDMLHHAADPGLALAEMNRLARPGGTVVVIEANRLNPVFYVHLTLLGDHQHFTRGRLKRLLGGAGMGAARISRAEARVWPVNRGWFQAAANLVQDGLEKVPFYLPLACYHLAQWRKNKA